MKTKTVPRRSKKSSKKKAAAAAPAQAPERNACLDSLRGLAISLMIVDHIAWLFFSQPIEPNSIRMLTRLSMPLFCVLTGFFVLRRRSTNWERLFQVALAAAAVNLAYFTLYGKVEILAALLLCYLAIAGIGSWFLLGSVAFLLYPLDVTSSFFDFPMSVVATCVAVGGVQRRIGWPAAMVLSVLIATGLMFDRFFSDGFRWVAAPTVYVLLMLPLAVTLTGAGQFRPHWRVPGLEWIGRYPLSIYVGQYLLLLLLAN